MGDVLTTQQVAEFFQVHVKTINRLARRGVIPGSKVGRGWRFSKDHVYRIINLNEEMVINLSGVSQKRGH
jgi:excisionase family DNA binding protein